MRHHGANNMPLAPIAVQAPADTSNQTAWWELRLRYRHHHDPRPEWLVASPGHRPSTVLGRPSRPPLPPSPPAPAVPDSAYRTGPLPLCSQHAARTSPLVPLEPSNPLPLSRFALPLPCVCPAAVPWLSWSPASVPGAPLTGPIPLSRANFRTRTASAARQIEPC